MKRPISWMAALLASMALGCGRNDGLARAAVSGQVTLDEVPLEEGTITFFPTGGTTGPPAGGPIVQGRYRLSANEGPIVGQHRVEIRSVRKTGRKLKLETPPEGEGAPLKDVEVDELKEILPDRYHSRSELTATIAAGTNDDVNFSLRSK